MKSILKAVVIVSLFANILFANALEDEAFNAYKNHNYKKSITLYKEAAKNNSLKAMLMLGLFSEKGIGVKQDTKRAIKFYKYILKRTSNIKSLLENPEEKTKLNITIAALERLYNLSSNKKYLEIAKKLKRVKSLNKKPNNDKKAIALFNQSGKSSVEEFLILCPPANVVAPEDREGLEDFDCALFENFPKRMALFMKLRRVRFEELATHKRGEEFLKKLDNKISKLIRPMIKYLQQATIDCYSNAETNMDLKTCDYDYLLKTDPLLFDNAAYKMEQALANSDEKTYPLGDFERETLVNKLIEKISNQEYGKPYRNMVEYSLALSKI